MKSCIRRLFSYSVLILIAAVLLLPIFGAAYARSPKAEKFTIFGQLVGVDPHLKDDLQVDSGIVRDLGGGVCSITVDGVENAIMRDIRQLVKRQERGDSA